MSPVTRESLIVPTKEERRQVFDRIDFNGNGILSLAEIDKAVVEIWPQFNHKKALMRAYKAADVSGDGFIGRREFRLLCSYIVYFNELWHKFDTIDRDHDHRVSLSEFRLGCQHLGLKISAGQAAEEFGRMDRDGGGFVIFDEFCAWCARRHAPVEAPAPAPLMAAAQPCRRWGCRGGRIAVGSGCPIRRTSARQC